MTQQKKAGWLREQMPRVAALVDEHRALYGDQHVDACVRAGMRGEPNQFYAVEGGQVIGTVFTAQANMVHVGMAFALGAAALVMRVPPGHLHDPREVVPELPRVRLPAPAARH